MTATYSRPGQTNITRLQIVKYDENWRDVKYINIFPQVLTINIYEDIQRPTIYADVLVKDTVNLLQNFPIIGQEFLEIEFQTPGNNEYSSYAFAIIGAANKTPLPTNQGQFYVLRCISYEHIATTQKIVSKSYSDRAENIIQNILDEYLDISNPQKPDYGIRKPFYSEETKDTIKLTIPKLNALKAIDMVAKRAISKENSASPFFFYESKWGFNFFTLDWLIKYYREQVGPKVYTMSTTPNISKIPGFDFDITQFRNIEAFEVVKNLDTFQKIQRGAVKNIVRSFDFTTKNFSKQTFDIGDSNIATTDPDGSISLTSTIKNRYKDAAVERLVPTNQDIGTNIIDNMGGKQATGAFFGELTVNILVAGDNALTVGDIIEIKMPDLSGTTAKKDDDRLTSGNYLITKLRHMFSGDEHKMSMQVTKLGVAI